MEKRKDDFISKANHELKTTLTNLRLFNQLLFREVETTNVKASHHLKRMDEQLDKLHLLVNDLLDITNIQAGRLELFKEHISINNPRPYG